MTDEEIMAGKEVASEFVEMVVIQKWPTTGLPDEFLAEALISHGCAVLAARFGSGEAARRLRPLVDALELAGKKPAGEA
jgi:hypothetical protein